MIHVTPLWGGLLALLFAALSLRVILNRGRARILLGHGEDAALERAVRAHANFAEYVPLALVLMATAELSGAPSWLLHASGLALLAGRAVHAYGLARERLDLRLRPLGMGLTFAALSVLAATNLVTALR